MKKTTPKILALILMVTLSVSGQSKYWSQIETSELSRSNSLSNFKKDAIKTFSLNLTAFKQELESAPTRGEFAGKSNTIVSFPNEKGKITHYRVMELPILSPELAAENPNIKAYLGFSVENPNERIRFSVTPQGVQMMVSAPDKNTTFLVPLDKYGSNEYIAYSRQSKINSVKEFECFTADEFIKIDESGMMNRDANDQILRTFRIAISTTGEYTNFWDDGNAGNGNAQQDALAQVVATLNRNNEVFEVDMAVTFQLVSGISIIFPNAATDPYTGNLNSQLQSTLTANVGEANYDIGHLFDFGGNNGNAGCIGCVCVNNQKGSGFSSHSFTDNDGGPYMSDFFDIDYVPHEIGHQMGANHTWSFASEGTGVNVEPGSGTTVMGYAGITGPDDVQDHSDPYFHYASINQILNRLTTRTCWVGAAITNSPPVANAGNDYTIPRGTAFVLTASATDSDGADNLTYTWEELDNGVTTSGNFGPTRTTGALWRSRPPSASPSRYMPTISRVVSGQLTQTSPTETVNNTSWETVSTVARTLSFGLTVRDRSEANGTGQFPQNDFDAMIVTVNAATGPFTVSSQATAVTWNPGESKTVTWNVANTNVAPINTTNVNILLSTDGGFTYPITLVANTPNDGSQDVTVPNLPSYTNMARVKVEAIGNIYYAISPVNFEVTSTAPEFFITALNVSQSVCGETSIAYNFEYAVFNGFNETTTFSATGNPAGTSVVFSPTSLNSNGTYTMTINGLNAAAAGTYSITVTGTSTSLTRTSNVSLTKINGACASVANTVYLTSTTGVNFGTIDNQNTGKPSGYSNYTAISTDVNRESSYPMTIKVNTDGNFLCRTLVWIDWNQNCSFADAGETYDLGTTQNVTNGNTSLSPLSITIPAGAALGATLMRVSTKYASAPTACENGADAEVEDYTVNVMTALSVNEFDASNFLIFPNPNKGEFTIKLNSNSNSNIKVEVYDVRGRAILNTLYGNTSEFNQTINLNNVQSGMYLVKISDGERQSTKKIIVE